MTWPAIAGTIANVNSSAILGIYVADATSNKWQTLGDISEPKLNIVEFTTTNQLGHNRTNKAYSITASAKMNQCSVVEVELLDSLCAGTCAWLFKLADAATVTTSAAYAGWVKFTAAQVNVRVTEIKASGTPEDTRQITLEWVGSIAKTDVNEIAMFTPTLETANFASSADSATAVFYTWGNYTAATDGGSSQLDNILSCGASSVKLDIAGGSGVTIAPVNNMNLTISALSSPDDLLRPITHGWDIAVEFDQMSTLNADLLLLGNATVDTAKAIITMIDGMVFTFDNQTGILANFKVLGDMEQNRSILWTLKGKILKSSLDGVVS